MSTLLPPDAKPLPQPYGEDTNPLFRPIVNYLNGRVEKNIEKYVTLYATHPDGSRDEALATRIEVELKRRGSMSIMLDVIEPLIAGVASFAAVAGGTFLLNKHFGSSLRDNLAKSTIVGAIAFAVQFVRGFTRFDAALHASAQTALQMETEYRNRDGAFVLADPFTALPPTKNWRRDVKERGDQAIESGVTP